MVPCLHQGNIYIKRNLRAWRDQKLIPLVVAKTPLTCAGHQATPSQGSLYRPENGNLRKLGCTYHHGTVFAPRQYFYQKEATAMERPEMYSPSLCKNSSYLCWLSNYPSQGSRYRPENGNLHKLGWTYRHGTVFAPRQCLYQKEATGTERPKTYSITWCKKPSRAVKLLRIKGVCTGPRTETCVDWGALITTVPCLHQGNVYIKRKLCVWRGQKCILLVYAKTPLTVWAVKLPISRKSVLARELKLA